MRTEILTDNIDTIKDSSFVGYQWLKSKHRGIIVEKTSGEFVGLGKDLSAVSKWTKKSKKEYAQHALSKNGEGGARIFRFDNLHELYLWLANPN